MKSFIEDDIISTIDNNLALGNIRYTDVARLKDYMLLFYWTTYVTTWTLVPVTMNISDIPDVKYSKKMERRYHAYGWTTTG